MLASIDLGKEEVRVRPAVRETANMANLVIPPTLLVLDCGANCDYYFGPEFDFANIRELSLGQSDLRGLNLGIVEKFCTHRSSVNVDISRVKSLTLAASSSVDIGQLSTGNLCELYIPFASEVYFDGLDFSRLTSLTLSEKYSCKLSRVWPALVNLTTTPKALVKGEFPVLTRLRLLSHGKVDGKSMPMLTTLFLGNGEYKLANMPSLVKLSLTTGTTVVGLNYSQITHMIVRGKGVFNVRQYRGTITAPDGAELLRD